tara:strand:+ start:28631 stop:29245 length:615 start_codon:yes stop_codon:yes gene_type:complete
VNEYALLFLVVFGINLLPAFGPPTWSVILLFGLRSQLPLPALVVIAALASSSGRYVLAHLFRLFASRLSERTKSNLAAARAAFERKRHSGLMAIVFFAVSPLPSAQMFGAIGLAGVRLVPFVGAFFLGRLVSYSFYAGSAQLVAEHTSLGQTFRETLTSPLSIAIQLVMLAGLVALTKIDWARWLGKPDEEAGKPAEHVDDPLP